MSVVFYPIGTIHSPFENKAGMPVQPAGAIGVKGKIIIKDELVPGLKDLSGFSHLFLIYHFHQSSGYQLQTTPFMDDKPHGVFATRAPQRPNAIGISVVKLLAIVHNVLEIENVDVLDGTPLLDIKPYVPDFDVYTTEKNGWLDNKAMNVKDVQSDKRFGK